MMTGLDGARAVVTGGASGIGLAIGRALVTAGAEVLLADIDTTALREAASGIGAQFQRVDVTDTASVEDLAAGCAERLGPVDIVVSNAGVASAAPLVETTEDDLRWLLDVNLLGTARTVRAFLPDLRARRGHLLVTGSTAGFVCDPGLGGYTTSKFALTAYTETLATELDGEVGVTLLLPGPVPTRLGSSSRNRPATGARGLVDVDLVASGDPTIAWVQPETVAAIALDAIRENRLYGVTHPVLGPQVCQRHRRIETAFGATASEG